MAGTPDGSGPRAAGNGQVAGTAQHLEEALLGQAPRYTQQQIADLSGLPLDYCVRVWRALGFSTPPADAIAFTEQDLDALRRIRALLGGDLVDEEMVVRHSRAVGQTMGRLASWMGDDLLQRLVAQSTLPIDGTADEDAVVAALGSLRETLLPQFEHLLLQGWRRQLTAYGMRTLAGAGDADPAAGTAVLAVGFTDVVSFTRLSRRLGAAELADLVDRFEGSVTEVAADLGGRIVKTLGDEVLFCADDPVVAAEIALRVAEPPRHDLPEVRTGLAYGQVVLRHGDVYGTTVNLAARLTSIAYPGTVLVDTALAREVIDDEAYHTNPLRSRPLHGLGRVRPVALRRAAR